MFCSATLNKFMSVILAFSIFSFNSLYCLKIKIVKIISIGKSANEICQLYNIAIIIKITAGLYINFPKLEKEVS